MTLITYSILFTLNLPVPETLQKSADIKWLDHACRNENVKCVSGKIVVTHHRYCWLGSYDERDLVCHHGRRSRGFDTYVFTMLCRRAVSLII